MKGLHRATERASETPTVVGVDAADAPVAAAKDRLLLRGAPSERAREGRREGEISSSAAVVVDDVLETAANSKLAALLFKSERRSRGGGGEWAKDRRGGDSRARLRELNIWNGRTIHLNIKGQISCRIDKINFS